LFEYLDREIIVASVLSIFLLGLLRCISKNGTTWYLKILFLLTDDFEFITSGFLFKDNQKIRFYSKYHIDGSVSYS